MCGIPGPAHTSRNIEGQSLDDFLTKCLSRQYLDWKVAARRACPPLFAAPRVVEGRLRRYARTLTSGASQAMRIIETRSAPNPRRVRIFLAEKQIAVPFEEVDIMQGELRNPEFIGPEPAAAGARAGPRRWERDCGIGRHLPLFRGATTRAGAVRARRGGACASRDVEPAGGARIVSGCRHGVPSPASQDERARGTAGRRPGAKPTRRRLRRCSHFLTLGSEKRALSPAMSIP